MLADCRQQLHADQAAAPGQSTSSDAGQLRRLVGPGARVPRFLLAGTSTYTLVTSPPPPPPISSPAPAPPLAGGDGGGRGRDGGRGADTGRDAESGGERSRRSTHDGRATPVPSPLRSPQSSGRSPQQLSLPSKPQTRAAGAAAVLMDLPSRVLAALERSPRGPSPQPHRPTNDVFSPQERQRRR
ncbi:hypothetical protein PLESTB_001763100 [Pleodorina starrii]|uniref:Uncharacterized protein n=1 Tax=Pleodorina starrii TaxID=330485 RepID=A0A9W6F9M7_9CHLO|nr:hypothetical protein PLESTB_001763100 [Pleodorina starrii]